MVILRLLVLCGVALVFDIPDCYTFAYLSDKQELLDEQVAEALFEFYKTVNKYFAEGVDNYNLGYRFNFAFEMVSNDVSDDDPDVEAMLQYTNRMESPQDVHIHIRGGKACKFVTSELIIPAYTYLLTKCNKMNFSTHESSDRRFGAPIVCVPKANADVIDPNAPRYKVSAQESPKLNDEMPAILARLAKEAAANKTDVFG